MRLFVLDMVMYLITLLGAMMLLVFAAWKFATFGQSEITTVLLAIPFLCWCVAYGHWHAYERAKTGVLNVVKILSAWTSSDFLADVRERVFCAVTSVAIQLNTYVVALIFGSELASTYACSYAVNSRQQLRCYMLLLNR